MKDFSGKKIRFAIDKCLKQIEQSRSFHRCSPISHISTMTSNTVVSLLYNENPKVVTGQCTTISFLSISKKTLFDNIDMNTHLGLRTIFFLILLVHTVSRLQKKVL